MELRPFTEPKITTPSDHKLMRVAQKLEVSFLSEMLKSAGFGEVRDSFNGGPGEEHFSSFLVDAQAEKMVETGGIGLAEKIFYSLKMRQNDV